MRDHKSLLAWQCTRAVVDAVVVISSRHWSPPAAPFIAQIARAATSVQLNIAEGYARRVPRQFCYHLNIAFGSAVETVELLEILTDHGLIPTSLGRETLLTAIRGRGLTLGLLHRYQRLSK